jgi:hypothetical protein
MTSNPWMKFYPSDWRSDPRLRMCSLAARGLWMEMLALMHDANPYGHLLVGTCIPSPEQLALLVGAMPSEVRGLLAELEAAGVFSRNGKSVIYSRRMVEDEKKAKIARKNGKAGGNPNLCKTKDNSPPDNPTHKPHVNGEDKTQSPEARNQSLNRRDETRAPDLSRPVNSAEEIAHRVAELARLDAKKIRVDMVEAWLAAGCDPDRDIYPAVRYCVGRAPEPIGSFRYFDAEVRRHHDQRTALPPSNVSYLPNAAGGRRGDPPMSPAARDLLAAYHDPNFDYGVRR